MSNPLTDARLTVVDALQAALLDVPIHSGPPATLQPPCIVVLPADEPWLDVDGVVGIEITVIAGLPGGKKAALTRLEELAYAAREALYAANLSPDQMRVPRVEGGGLEARFTVALRTTCR